MFCVPCNRELSDMDNFFLQNLNVLTSNISYEILMPFGYLWVQKYFQHFFTVKPGYSKPLFCIFLRNFGKKQIYICFASTWLYFGDLCYLFGYQIGRLLWILLKYDLVILDSFIMLVRENILTEFGLRTCQYFQIFQNSRLISH